MESQVDLLFEKDKGELVEMVLQYADEINNLQDQLNRLKYALEVERIAAKYVIDYISGGS